MRNTKSTIFYFTGTGNSLYVAKRLADKLGDSALHAMASYRPTGQIGGAKESIGFVFPSYYGSLPRLVRRFIEGLDISADTWLFGIVTMGAPFGLGNGSAVALEKALADKGLQLRYCVGLTMPRNYVLKYNPLSADSGIQHNAKADRRTAAIAGEIKAQKSRIQKCFITSNKLYENIEALDADFHVESHCNGCGQCEKICPVQNIVLVDSRPTWQHHCEHCVACISWCPQGAIQYGAETKKRRRYHNPGIKASELP